MTTVPHPPEAAEAAPLDWGDSGLRSHQRLAARLATWAGRDVCYVHGTGWHRWDGTRWAHDDADAHVNAKLTELLQLSWAQAMTDRALEQDVRASMTAAGSRGVLDLASKRMLITEVDADPWVFNCQNGTLDLHTLELRHHNPSDHITKVAGAAYDPGARSGEWDRFLAEVLPNPKVLDYLQRYVGVALVGKVLEHVLGIATGSGRNGKGVTARTVSRMFGDYAVEASNDMLTVGRHGHKSAGELSALMALRGARWATMTETDRGAALAEATLKYVTGGDRITAKLMGRDWVEFDPSHSLLMSTNDLPQVDADAVAVWARLRVLPFDVSFEGREDTGLEDRLALDVDAVLTWAVEGLRAWQTRGLEAPEAVRARTQAYRAENDPLARFIEDRCELGPDESVMRATLSTAYSQWAQQCREKDLDPQALAKRLKHLPGVGDAKVKGIRKWTGIGLRESTDRTGTPWEHPKM